MDGDVELAEEDLTEVEETDVDETTMNRLMIDQNTLARDTWSGKPLNEFLDQLI